MLTTVQIQQRARFFNTMFIVVIVGSIAIFSSTYLHSSNKLTRLFMTLPMRYLFADSPCKKEGEKVFYSTLLKITLYH